MAINLSDNLSLAAPKPLDARYLNASGGAYASVAEANAATTGKRHVGMTVLIGTLEYWYRDGIADNHLVQKLSSGTSNSLAGVPVELANLNTDDILTVESSTWKNKPRETLVDGGNF